MQSEGNKLIVGGKKELYCQPGKQSKSSFFSLWSDYFHFDHTDDCYLLPLLIKIQPLLIGNMRSFLFPSSSAYSSAHLLRIPIVSFCLSLLSFSPLPGLLHLYYPRIPSTKLHIVKPNRSVILLFSSRINILNYRKKMSSLPKAVPSKKNQRSIKEYHINYLVLLSSKLKNSLLEVRKQKLKSPEWTRTLSPNTPEAKVSLKWGTKRPEFTSPAAVTHPGVLTLHADLTIPSKTIY